MTVEWLDGVQVTVEISFTTDPLATPSWVDVSADVRDISTSTGRNNELDEFTAGSMSVVLDNRTRKYDPEYSSGAYYGNIKPGKKIRLSFVHDSNTYREWTGYIDEWQQAYEMSNSDAECILKCSDAFSILSRATLPTDYYGSLIESEGPSIWYRFRETLGAVAWDSSGNGIHGNYSEDAVGTGADQIVPYAEGASYKLSGEQYCLFPYVSSGTPCKELWFQFDALPTATAFLFNDMQDGWAYVTTTGVLYADWGSSGLGTVNSGRAISLNQPHHLVVQENGALWEAWLDGVYLGTDTFLSAGWVFDYTPTPGVGLQYTVAGFAQNCRIAEFVCWSSALTEAEVLAHYQAGLNPFGDQFTGERLDATLDLIGWPAGERDIDTGRSKVQPAKFPTFALEYAKHLESTEQGRLYVEQDGNITFRDRDSLLVDTTSQSSQATFGDIAGELRYADLEFDYGRSLIRNRVRATRDGGVAQESFDQTSIDDYGEAGDDLGTLPLANDAQALGLTQHRLAKFKDPALRIAGMTVTPMRDPDNLIPEVLGLKIGDRITVKRRPMGGSAITKDVIIEGISHSISNSKEWTVSFAFSPAETSDYWQLNVSELGTDTKLWFY